MEQNGSRELIDKILPDDTYRTRSLWYALPAVDETGALNIAHKNYFGVSVRSAQRTSCYPRLSM